MSYSIFHHQKYHCSYSLSPQWKQVENFKNKHAILESSNIPNILNNDAITEHVQVTEKFSYHFSSCERLLRILIGIILVILTLGLILIYKPARQLFYKNHISIKIVKPYGTFPKELDETKVQEAILSNIENIKNKTSCANVQHFSSTKHVFSLTEFPNWIFKIKFNDLDNKDTLARFSYTQELRNTCRKHNFNNVIIPEAHLMTIDLHGTALSLIIEKKIDIENNPHLQEKLYSEHKNEYQLALEQLTHLICQADLKDINWEKCPLLLDTSTNTFSKIVLLGAKPKPWMVDDLGLFGCLPFKRGIIGCVLPEQFPTIKSIISKYNKNIKAYNTAINARIAELQRNRKLQKFYQARGITVGNEPIALDPTSLLKDIDLNLNESHNGITMREAFLETVEHINKKLADIPAHPDSIQQARIISLDTASDKLFKYHQGVFAPPTYNNQSTHDNEKTWLAHIVHALIQKGVLFEVMSYTSCAFKVQA